MRAHALIEFVCNLRYSSVIDNGDVPGGHRKGNDLSIQSVTT